MRILGYSDTPEARLRKAIEEAAKMLDQGHSKSSVASFLRASIFEEDNMEAAQSAE